MASNRGVVYVGPGKVEVRGIEYPKLVNPQGKKISHGAILKVVVTNICGSDQHMYEVAPPRRPGWSWVTKSRVKWSKSDPTSSS